MQTYCGNCFQDTLNDRGICNVCGFDNNQNKEKSPHALPPGSILNGRYIIGRVLGQGGFGITYTAQDYQTKNLVAVKEFFPDSMATRHGRTAVVPFSGERGENYIYGRDSFLQEAQTMAQFIGNSNIVQVYSYFEENGTGYFVMEYVEGESLQDYLRSHGSRLSFEEVSKLLFPVMDALSAVHEKGIIHRDIAPDNIHVAKDGTVKLLDFGAARYSLGNVSRSLDMILKHGFAPKEQYKRRGHQGPYTDIYSLAATMYFAITGVRPDDAIERVDEDTLPYPSSLGASITPAQEDVLLKAMSVDAEDRYQTVDEFRSALQIALEPPAASLKPPKAPKEPKTPKSSETASDIHKDPTNFAFPEFIQKYRAGILSAAVLVAVVLIFVICHANCVFGHDWSDATCTEAKFCFRCGEKSEAALGHTFLDATCDAPKTCSVCGKTQGKALGHSFSDATCGEPMTCTRCGFTQGSSLSHDYQDATCTKPATCSNCGATQGLANGHTYNNATCTKPKTCSICGATSGTALGHNWTLVSGTRTEKCSRCGTTRKSQDGLVETLAGHWSSERSDVGGTRTPTWVFEEKVTGCVEFTLHYQIVSVSQGDPFGSHKLYAKNAHGKWVVIGKFDVKDKNEVVKTFTFDEPQTFTQLVVISQAAGYYNYTDSMWLENFYFE